MSVYFKFLRLFMVLVVGVFFLVGSGGGGSSDDNSSIENQRIISGNNISTEVKDDVLIVTEEGDLKGLAVKGVDASTNIENIQFQKVSTKPLPEIPNFITKITDFFVIENGVEEEVFVRVPLSKMPKDVDLNHLYLYTLVTTAHQLTPFWSPTLLERGLFNKSGEKYIEFKLVGFRNNTYFIGTEYSTEEEKSSLEKVKKEKDIISFKPPLNLSGITCTPAKEYYFWKNYSDQTCRFKNTKNENIIVNVLGFGKGTRWGDVTIEEMVNWIKEAQKKLDDMGLEYDKKITMHIHKLDNNSNVAQYVHDSRTIDIRNDDTYSNEMNKTIEHEYFHHVQWVNTNAKIDSHYCKKKCDDYASGVYNYTAWLEEGSADWFSKIFRASPQPIILEKSLVNDSEQYYKNYYSKGNSNEAESPYRRSLFFHMISSHCNKYFFKKLFKEINDSSYKTIPNDKSESLQTALNDSECHFNFLGIEDNSLANVLLYYQYATAWQNDITLLDKNLKKGSITFKKSETYTDTLNKEFTVPPYGVKSYIFKLSKFNQMHITKNINGLKYYLLKKNKSGGIVDEANEVKVPLDTDIEYFIVFVNDSEKDISGSIEIFSGDTVINKEGILMWQDNIDAKNLLVTRYTTVLLQNCETEECINEYYKPVASTYCTNLILANHSDWRLPTELELLGAKSDTNIFHNFTYDSRYWTDKSVVYFGEPEEENFDLSTGSAHIRCVRDNITYDEKTVEQNLLNALKLKWNTDSDNYDKKEEKLNAFMTQIKETGFVNHVYDTHVDYASYYILHKSMKFLGHIVKVIEYDEAPYGHIGCCIDIGISMILKQVGSLDKIEKFAKDNQCTLSSYASPLGSDYESVDQALSGETNLIKLSCHHSDVNWDSADENNISRISKVKKTGQTKSYDEYGNEVTDGSIKDDGYYQKGVTPSYIRDDEKEIVTDNITKLQWQDNDEAKIVRKKWEDAKSYCANLTLGGYSDWRLPTVIELQSIVVDDKNLHSLDYATSNYYWSSTKDVSFIDDTLYAWGVYFGNGIVYNYSKYIYSNVACVRAGQ